jgi:hypothetical protein
MGQVSRYRDLLHRTPSGLESQLCINNFMDYKHIYDSLIQKRQQEPPEGYSENHHIVMKSMGGLDNSENKVRLTGREHWVAHQLLYKIHRNKQTIYACHMMAMRCEERAIPQIKSSRMYEHIRKSCIKLWRSNGRKRTGEASSSYGTMWICNEKLHLNKKIKNTEQPPEGWEKGRNLWNRKPKVKAQPGKKISKIQKQRFANILEQNKPYLLQLVEEWNKGEFKSLNYFVNKTLKRDDLYHPYKFRSLYSHLRGMGLGTRRSFARN